MKPAIRQALSGSASHWNLKPIMSGTSTAAVAARTLPGTSVLLGGKERQEWPLEILEKGLSQAAREELRRLVERYLNSVEGMQARSKLLQSAVILDVAELPSKNQ
jgi:hypothetical protein